MTVGGEEPGIWRRDRSVGRRQISISLAAYADANEYLDPVPSVTSTAVEFTYPSYPCDSGLPR
ncbi:hypothetical protein R3Q06_33955 [Rhodococcus erythropolis]|uniref:hypothetical protein n=1 Tax=Rhodococcus erythropolis TaxID=1833 RepID=UPI0029499E95|nr:hypothetical protein [Rhodococcus erythropolis]MDV6278431.1 hypothetical protein [Rhodococcus erythropolis]